MQIIFNEFCYSVNIKNKTGNETISAEIIQKQVKVEEEEEVKVKWQSTITLQVPCSETGNVDQLDFVCYAFVRADGGLIGEKIK